ncbi:MAG TPA: hypothetical protein VGF43_14420, partial [Dongiaceae bacterium]
ARQFRCGPGDLLEECGLRPSWPWGTAMTEGYRRLAKSQETQDSDDDDDHADDVEHVHIRLSAIMTT